MENDFRLRGQSRHALDKTYITLKSTETMTSLCWLAISQLEIMTSLTFKKKQKTGSTLQECINEKDAYLATTKSYIYFNKAHFTKLQDFLK